eukprot:COSAG01_NODE_5242_length_4389_cov_100.681352_3_plen_208_part_00
MWNYAHAQRRFLSALETWHANAAELTMLQATLQASHRAVAMLEQDVWQCQLDLATAKSRAQASAGEITAAQDEVLNLTEALEAAVASRDDAVEATEEAQRDNDRLQAEQVQAEAEQVQAEEKAQEELCAAKEKAADVTAELEALEETHDEVCDFLRQTQQDNSWLQAEQIEDREAQQYQGLMAQRLPRGGVRMCVWPTSPACWLIHQ